MLLRCKQIRQDVPTVNGRVYSREALDRIATLSNHQSLDGRCMLAVDTDPADSRLSLANVVGKVHTAVLNDGYIEIEVEFLDTPKGAPVKALTPGLIQQVFSVAPLLFGTTNDGINIDPYSLAFNGWALVKP